MSSRALGILGNESPRTLGLNGDFARISGVLVPFVTVTLVLLAVKPNMLRPLFPAAACFVGFWIYKRNESYYLSFALWIYMLTPLLRRLVDWRLSYQEQSMILLAPLVITLLPAIHLRRRLATVSPVIRTFVLFTFAGIAFGAGVGMIKHPGLNVVLATATWSAPIVLCVFAASIRDRETLDRVLTRTFLVGVLIISVYGVYQFVAAPPWDVYWLRQISADSVAPSFGQPKAMAIRVWSTMNGPGALAVWLSAALIWIGTRDGIFPILVSTTGYIALSLTLVRSAWLQTILAFLILLCGYRTRSSARRALTTILVLAIVAGVFLRSTPSAGIYDRLRTFSSLGTDESFNERQEMYRYMTGLILSTPLGTGLTSIVEVHGYPIDSSLVQLFYMLGWVGGLCYLSGLVYFLVHVTLRLRSLSKAQAVAAAVALTVATQLFTGDLLYRQGGIVFCMFAGIWASV